MHLNQVRRGIAVLLCICLVSVGTAQTEVELGRPRALTYAAEFGAGVGIIALGAAGLLLYTFALAPPIGALIFLVNWLVTGDDDMDARWLDIVTKVGVITLSASVPLISGAAVMKVGTAMGDRRSLWPGVAGAYAGTAAGVGASLLVYRSRPHENGFSPGNDWPYIVASVASTALGATVGYSLGRVAPERVGLFGPRIGLPSLALTRAELHDGSVVWGADLRLVSVRF